MPKTHTVGANFKGGSEDFYTKRKEIAANRAVKNVNRRYFRVDGRFSDVGQR